MRQAERKTMYMIHKKYVSDLYDKSIKLLKEK